jgi:uncharacterized protein (TIGR03437 family)
MSSLDGNPIINVVDGASFKPVLAPGGIFTIFGENLPTGPSSAESLPFPLLLGAFAFSPMGVKPLCSTLVPAN